MIATINEDGCLTISGETSLEKYALSCWMSQWKERRATLLVAPFEDKIEPLEPPE